METTEDKYIIFKNWLKQEGVIMPKLQYPAIYDGGLIGTKVTADILHREVYIYVPEKLIISVQ
jgi:hypothetical protein